jgi:Zn-dependent peptidase ImmA (M78 family)
MRIPEKVRVGSMIYSVTQGDKTLLINNKACKGLISYEKHEIEINNSVQDKQGAEQTFLHELVHAIVYERNITLEKTDEEVIVDELATGLHQVIMDNPDIFKESE